MATGQYLYPRMGDNNAVYESFVDGNCEPFSNSNLLSENNYFFSYEMPIAVYVAPLDGHPAPTFLITNETPSMTTAKHAGQLTAKINSRDSLRSYTRRSRIVYVPVMHHAYYDENHDYLLSKLWDAIERLTDPKTRKNQWDSRVKDYLRTYTAYNNYMATFNRTITAPVSYEDIHPRNSPDQQLHAHFAKLMLLYPELYRQLESTNDTYIRREV